MTNIWFCSDHHFGHENIIKWSARSKFSSIEEHDEILIQNHNDVVSNNDEVYLLGDICWASSSIGCLKRLKGKKTLIMGNHDKQSTNSYGNAVQKIKGCSYFGKGIKAILTHIPIHPCQLQNNFEYNIHGHMHAYYIDNPRYFNVSMEQIDYTPIEVSEIIEILGKLDERPTEGNWSKPGRLKDSLRT